MATFNSLLNKIIEVTKTTIQETTLRTTIGIRILLLILIKPLRKFDVFKFA